MFAGEIFFYCFGVRYAMFTREVIVLECGTLLFQSEILS